MIGHRPRRLLVVAAALAVAPLDAQAQPPAQPVTQQAAPPATQPIALSLEEALGLIPERSEPVRIAAAGVDRAHGQLRQARSQLFPQLTGTVNYQRTLESQFEAIASAAGDGVEEPADDTAANPLAGISRI